MRYSYAFLLFSLAIFAVVACTDFREEDVPAFGVSDSRIELMFTSTSFSINVTSGKEWDVSVSPDWISLQAINHSGNHSYEWNAVFDVAENDEFDREGLLLFNAGSNATQVVVSQKGKKGKYIAVESISLSPKELTLTEGEFTYPTLIITPSNASVKDVIWTSSDPSIAYISSSGAITGKAVGTATITAKTKDGDKTATCTVTVKAKTIAVTGVSLDKTNLTLLEGDTQRLVASITPSNATNQSVTWSSDNTTVATVSSSGVVTAKSAGSATITVTTSDGNKKASCYVTVKSKNIAVLGVTLNTTSLSLNVGDSQALYATVTPPNATDKTVTWTSSNTSVATVSIDGVVTAKGAGNATISVTTNDGGKKATCSITVTPVSVTGVSLNKYSLSMFENDSETLIAIVSPSNATNKNVIWTSSNTSVATVNSIGQVQAKAAGSATITVTTEDGQKTANCSVSVTADPYGAVDLGLSVKWASFNFGASSITSTGGYYMWGDPTGSGSPMFFDPPSVNSISGSQYDIVRKNWGGNWRIPTRAEINELYNNCTWTSTTVNGVSVLKVTGRNGACIYLPYTGYGMPDDGPVGTVKTYDTNKAYMMSGESYGDSYGRFVYVFSFSSSGAMSSVNYNASFVSFPIRPVR